MIKNLTLNFEGGIEEVKEEFQKTGISFLIRGSCPYVYDKKICNPESLSIAHMNRYCYENKFEGCEIYQSIISKI